MRVEREAKIDKDKEDCEDKGVTKIKRLLDQMNYKMLKLYIFFLLFKCNGLFMIER